MYVNWKILASRLFVDHQFSSVLVPTTQHQYFNAANIMRVNLKKKAHAHEQTYKVNNIYYIHNNK